MSKLQIGESLTHRSSVRDERGPPVADPTLKGGLESYRRYERRFKMSRHLCGEGRAGSLAYTSERMGLAGAGAAKNILEYIRIYIAVTIDRWHRWVRSSAKVTIDR